MKNPTGRLNPEQFSPEKKKHYEIAKAELDKARVALDSDDIEEARKHGKFADNHIIEMGRIQAKASLDKTGIATTGSE